MKLNIGCGNYCLDEWVNLDIKKHDPKTNVLADARSLPFKDESFDEIYSSHLIEHFGFQETFGVLKEWKRVLREGGKLVVETPDFLGLCNRFLIVDEEERVRMYTHIFGWFGDPLQLHQFLYTATQLQWTLDLVGFRYITRVPALRYPGGEDINLKMECLK